MYSSDISFERVFRSSRPLPGETHMTKGYSYFTWNHARFGATVSQTTVRRLDQFVNEESSRTLANLDVVVPETAVVTPVITHFPRHNAFSHRRMSALHPAGCVGTAAVHRNAGSRHTSSRCASESIPSGLWHGTLIAALIHRIRVQPGLVIQGRVRGAFIACERDAAVENWLQGITMIWCDSSPSIALKVATKTNKETTQIPRLLIAALDCKFWNKYLEKVI